MDELNLYEFVKEHDEEDYVIYLSEYDDLEDYLRECYILYNWAMKIKTSNRIDKLNSISRLALLKLEGYSNSEINKYIEKLNEKCDVESTLGDLERDWAFKAKSLKKVEDFVKKHNIHDRHAVMLRRLTVNYQFDPKIEEKLLEDNNKYPKLYDSEIDDDEYGDIYENNKEIRRNLAIISKKLNHNLTISSADLIDIDNEKVDIDEEYNKLLNSDELDLTVYVINRLGFRLPEELIRYYFDKRKVNNNE